MIMTVNALVILLRSLGHKGKSVPRFVDTGTYYLPWYNRSCELLIACYEKLGSDDLVKDYRSTHLGWKWTSEDNRREVINMFSTSVWFYL